MRHTEANTMTCSCSAIDQGECDVLVVGGGIAGVVAALAAARSGAQTVLIEDHAYLGGLVTSWGHICFCSDTVGVGSVFDDIITEMSGLGGIDPYVPFQPELICKWDYHTNWEHSLARLFDVNIFRMVLAHMIQQQTGLRPLLRTRFVAAETEDGRVHTVIFHNVSGLQAIRPQVVVDATGDADLCHAAGFPCFAGREEDGLAVPMALRVTMRDEGAPVSQHLPSWGKAYQQESESLTVFSRNEKGHATFRSNVVGFDPTNGDQLSQAELHCQSNTVSVINYLQRNGYENYALDNISMELGVRIGRRIRGEYVLTDKDATSGASFDDAVARGTANLSSFLNPDRIADGHSQSHEPIAPYQIPYRSFIPQGSANVLTAGRCISAQWWALSSARMAPTCAMMGHAAGLAAAQSVAYDKDVPRIDISVLQSELKKQAVHF